MKKKLVSILLCAALAVSAFTGCGSSDPEEEAKSKAAAEGSGTESENGTETTGAEVSLHMQLGATPAIP